MSDNHRRMLAGWMVIASMMLPGCGSDVPAPREGEPDVDLPRLSPQAVVNEHFNALTISAMRKEKEVEAGLNNAKKLMTRLPDNEYIKDVDARLTAYMTRIVEDRVVYRPVQGRAEDDLAVVIVRPYKDDQPLAGSSPEPRYLVREASDKPWRILPPIEGDYAVGYYTQELLELTEETVEGFKELDKWYQEQIAELD